MIDALWYVVSGIYFTAAVLLGLELAFNFIGLHHVKVTPPMHIFGVAMLSDSLTVVVHVLERAVWPGGAAFPLILTFTDLWVTDMFLLAGFSLLTGRFPQRKEFDGVVLSSVALYVVYLLTENLTVFSVLTMVWLTALMVIVAVRARKYNQMLFHRYSNVDKHKVTWYIHILVWVFLIYPLYKATTMDLVIADIAYPVYMLAMSAMYVFMARNVINQTAEAWKHPESLPDRSDGVLGVAGNPELSHHTAESLFSSEQLAALQEQMTQLMTEEKLYRDADLTVDGLVRRLNTNSSYFYYFMRDVVKSSFFDYVNGYRIEEAKQQLAQGAKVEDVAADCGFNSANTFRRVFKKITGMTPSEWRANVG